MNPQLREFILLQSTAWTYRQEARRDWDARQEMVGRAYRLWMGGTAMLLVGGIIHILLVAFRG